MAAPQPFFLDGPAGRLFALRRLAIGHDRGLDLVVVPPFAEEMNRARRMVALQTAALAEHGFGSLTVDPFGTGDSAGGFEDARWATWIEDIVAAVRWLAAERRGRVGLLGVRLGAVLAAEVARRSDPAIERLVLWQPVANGETFMTQFLRLRIAGDLAQADPTQAERARGSTRDLRARLAAGATLEVAGYALAPDLVAAIDRLRLAALTPPAGTAVDWFEVAQDPAQGIGPASRAVIEAWSAAGAAVTAEIVAGEPFWSLQETTIAPALLAATSARLTASAP